MQTILRRPVQEQLSQVQLREWQKFRGWKIKILEVLEHSGGEPTRAISDATGLRCHQCSNVLSLMLKDDLVERIERWGWRITVTGVFLLSLNYTTTTPQQHHNNTTTTPQQEKEEPVPPCFRLATCHIKQLCKDKGYTRQNMALCHGTAACIWGANGRDRIPLETKVRGVR